MMRSEIRIFAAVGVLLLLLVVVMFQAVSDAAMLDALALRITDSQRALATLSQMESELLTANLRERGFVITGATDDAAAYDTARVAITGLLRALDSASAGTSIGDDDLAMLSHAVRQTLAHNATVIDVRRRAGFEPAWSLVRSGKGESLLADARFVFRRLSREETTEIAALAADHQRSAGRVLAAIAVLGVLASALVVGILVVVRRHLAQQSLAVERFRESEARYRLLFDSNPESMWVYDRDTLRFLAVNDAAISHYGYSRAEFLGLTVRDIRPPEELAKLEEHLRAPANAATASTVVRHCTRDGNVIDVEIIADTIAWAGRSARLVLAKDITQRRRLEEQFRQAQKMEAVGRLAAGVAHDFNNLLTAVLGYSELLLQGMSADNPRHDDLLEIRDAALRGAALSRQLLTFSRKQVLAPAPLDVNELLRNVARLLGKLVGEDVSVVTVLEPGECVVMADAGQLEQVMMNLAVNARDAMPGGGILTIETAGVVLTGDSAMEQPSLRPGSYVRLAVTDNGIGMDEAVRARLFEPFFTTKEPGKGTGLGLATVYAIVKQSGGHIWVYSEPGRGATFKIYLPRVEERAMSIARPADAVRRAEPGETVLLVEDDAAVRAVAKVTLERTGYQVIEATDADAALDIVERYQGRLDLLLTDIVMPGKSGRLLAEELQRRRPGLAVLYMSGYTDDSVVRHGVLASEAAYLQKPFAGATLTAKVADAIAAARSRGPVSGTDPEGG